MSLALSAAIPQPSIMQPYNPRFDPLADSAIGKGMAYAPTYWVATAGMAPENDGPVQSDFSVDVAIIGGGFTGLAAALFLAKEHGIEVAVLEANQSAWGCTSRNGGQGQNASGRLYRSQWIQRWGLDTAKRLDREIRSGFDTFRELVSQVECDAQDHGHLYVAHREKKLGFLENEARVMREIFGYHARMLSRAQLREEFIHEQEACGALYEPEGVGVHPLKLAYGYQRLARSYGARVHVSSPVGSIQPYPQGYRLNTPGGVVTAKRVGIATGAYGGERLSPLLTGKIMPILSNSMVTRVLTADELNSLSVRKPAFITDTRTLRFYYRMLPDNRLQIGSRSAVHGRDAEDPSHLELLREGLARKFPALRGIDIDYSWWGWVDVSHDMMPRITQPDAEQKVFYAVGYGGNGVSFSAHAGRRMAERIVGKQDPSFDLPIYQSPLPGHLFQPFRRLGQAMLYRWYHLRDELL